MSLLFVNILKLRFIGRFRTNKISRNTCYVTITLSVLLRDTYYTCVTVIQGCYTRSYVSSEFYVHDELEENLIYRILLEHSRLLLKNGATILASGRCMGRAVETLQLHEGDFYPQF